MSSSLIYTIGGAIWALVVGFGVLLILALPSRLGFPAAALWMSAILMIINLTSGIFLIALARRVTKHKVLRISLIIAAIVCGYWFILGVASLLMYFTVRNYNIPDWLGMILYVAAEIIAPVVFLTAATVMIVSAINIIVNGIKARQKRREENAAQA